MGRHGDGQRAGRSWGCEHSSCSTGRHGTAFPALPVLQARIFLLVRVQAVKHQK